MASANTRLAAAGAPALLRETSLTLEFNGQIHMRDGQVVLGKVAQPSLQALALTGRLQRLANTSLTVHLMAAPAIRPVAPT